MACARVACVSLACQPSRTDVTHAQGQWLIDRAAETGLVFVHVNGMSGRFEYGEIIGAGVALIDDDDDGDLDVFLVQGGTFGPPRGITTKGPPGGRLFRNDLDLRPDGTRRIHFTDVTDASGIRATGYGMGVAVGDYDNGR